MCSDALAEFEKEKGWTETIYLEEQGLRGLGEREQKTQETEDRKLRLSGQRV